MIRKPRFFSLTVVGFEALESCEKFYPHLKRGQVVSNALYNMACQIEASRRAQFRLPDSNEWNLICRTLSELETFHHEIVADLNCQPLSISPEGEKGLKEKILFEVEELRCLRLRVSKLAPIANELSSRDHENLKRFIEIAKAPQADKVTAQGYKIAIKLLENNL